MRSILLLALALVARPALASDNCLYDAIEWQGIEQVRACLEQGADPNAPTQYGTTGQLNALMLALSRRKMDVAKLLRERGGKLDLSTDGGKDFWTNMGGSTVSQGGRTLALYNLPAIEAALEMGADINAPGRAGETIVMAAVRAGNLELVKELIARGAKLDARTESGETALHLAAWRGDTAAAAYLIEKGADVRARDRSEQTPAQHAASQGHEEAFELLAKHGATLSPEELGRLAQMEKSAPLVRKLMAGGARMGGDEVKRLARSGNWDMLETALAGGATADIELAKQPIWWMGDERQRAREGGATAVDTARYEAVLARLVKDAKPGKEQLDELLMLAIEKTDPAGVRVLVGLGADANAKTSYDATALARAAQTGDVATIRELVTRKADLEGAGRDGRTPLFTAVIHGQLEAVRALLEAGADPKHKDSMGLTAGHIARTHGNPQIAMLLAQRTGDEAAQDAARVRALVEAAMQEEPGPLAEAMKAQKDLDAADDQKRVALVQAATYGRVGNMAKLLDAGASADRLEGVCDGKLPPVLGEPVRDTRAPPQDAPAAAPRPPVAAPLPRQPVSDANVDADVDTPIASSSRVAGNRGWHDTCRSALIAAIEADRLLAVKLLLAHKAKVDIEVGATKRTALEVAARIGNPAVVRALLEAGASVVHADARGRTALDQAREAGNTKAARLIEVRR